MYIKESMYCISNKNISGFTLVETLVAISILLLVIVGPITIAQKGIRNAYFANEQFTAVFLAQEAIESVRQLRDADGLDAYDKLLNSVAGADTWNEMDSFADTCDDENCAYMRGENPLFRPCSDSFANNCEVTRSVSDGTLGHNPSADDTQFTRHVRVTDMVSVGADVVGIQVRVTVTWNAVNLGTRSVVFQTWIYDQYKRYE